MRKEKEIFGKNNRSPNMDFYRSNQASLRVHTYTNYLLLLFLKINLIIDFEQLGIHVRIQTPRTKDVDLEILF